jgi:prepilin-type processing-associated H-X9-DG protein
MYGRIGMLFVDGHEDVYTPHESTFGEAADMELGLALIREITVSSQTSERLQ